MRNLQLKDQNDSTTEALSDAKDRFKQAREKATEAFCNEALSTSDRVLAMQYRVMATLLEKVDNPANALAACRLCLEELHAMPVVQKNFSVQLKQGFKSWFNKAEREDIISSVCRVNRVIYDVTQMVEGGVNLFHWPCVDNGEEKVDPLRDSRVIETLRKLDMEEYCVAPWSFGQEGEEEQKLKSLCHIAANTQGQFIIVDGKDIKLFDSNGKFLYSVSSPNWGSVEGIATDREDNLYVLAGRWEGIMYVFDKHANLFRQLSTSFSVGNRLSMTVDDYNKVVQVASNRKIEVYDILNGRLRRTFGLWDFSLELSQRSDIKDIAATNDHSDGLVFVLASDRKTFEHYLNAFNAQGDHRFMFKVEEPDGYHANRIAFQQDSEFVAILCTSTSIDFTTDVWPSMFHIYAKDGELVRSIYLPRMDSIVLSSCSRGMVVTKNGRIAVCVKDMRTEKYGTSKVLVV